MEMMAVDPIQRVLAPRFWAGIIAMPLLAAVFLVLQAWSEMTYASFGLIFVALYAAYEMVPAAVRRCCQRVTGRQGEGLPTVAWAWWGLALLVFLIGIAPLLAAMVPDMRTEGDFWVEGSGFAEWFSADLLGFVVPTMHHPLLGGLIADTGIRAFEKGQHIYLGVTLLALSIVGLVRGRPGWKVRLWWFGAAMVFAWLTLGPTVHVNGADTGTPGPFAVLQSLPFFKGNRYPSRYSVLLILSLAMLASLGAAEVVRQATRRRGRWATRWLPLAFTALYLFEHLSLPLPQSDMRPPAAYRALGTEPTGTLLDIPFAWRNGFRITGPVDPGFMFGQFYQTVHGRRLLQGNTSRNPAFKFQYFTEAPVINSLLALETGHALPPERLEADRTVAADVLRFFDIGHIIVRRSPAPAENPAVTPGATLPYIETVLPVERLSDDGALAFYRVALPPLPKRVDVEAQSPLVRLYLGEGWGPLPDRPAATVETLLWAQRTGVRLLVPLAGSATRLTMRLFVPHGVQRVAVRLNGWQSAPIALDEGWAEIEMDLPSEVVQSGLNDVWLDFDRLFPLEEMSLVGVDSAAALRPASLPHDPVVVQSAGQEVGDFAHIYVAGHEIGLNERGYNLVAFPPDHAPVAVAFDTHLDPSASPRMAEFVANLPDGTLVAAAVADEASMNLSAEAVAALQTLGATGDLRGKFRWSHAVIGVKGDPPGTALEALDGLRPVTLSLGPAITAPSVAGGVAWLRFESR